MTGSMGSTSTRHSLPFLQQSFTFSIMGTGTVARPMLSRERPATLSDSKEVKPPTKRQRGPVKPGHKKLGRPKKVVPIRKITGLSSLPAEVIGRIASFLLPPNISVEDGFVAPWELPYGGHRSKSATAKIKEFRCGGIPSGVRDVLNLAVTCKRCDSGVGLVIGKIGDGLSEGKKRYVRSADQRGRLTL